MTSFKLVSGWYQRTPFQKKKRWYIAYKNIKILEGFYNIFPGVTHGPPFENDYDE